MLPGLFIFFYNIVKAGIVLVLPSIKKEEAVVYFFLTFVLQAVFAPIQGSISDHYCRKKSLVVAFLATAGALLLFYFSFSYGEHLFLAGIILYGVLGNAEVLGRAAMIDVYWKRERKRVMSWAFILKMVAFGMTGLMLLGEWFSPKLFLFYCWASVGVAVLALLFFRDRRDRIRGKWIHHVLKEDFHTCLYYLTHRRFYLGFLGLLFFEMAYDFSFYYQDAAIMQRFIEGELVLFFVVGFVVGSIALYHLAIPNRKAIMAGVLLGIFGHLLATLLAFGKTDWLQQSLGFFFFQFGSGICYPAIYTYFSTTQQPHAQGKLFGVLDSLQTIGEMTAAAVLLYAVVFTAKIIGIISILIFTCSFFLFFKHIERARSQKGKEKGPLETSSEPLQKQD